MKHNFRELQIWKRSKSLCLNIYKLTSQFPENEKFGLTNQIRRCSVSVPSNIAEGCGRNTDKQLTHFLNIAMGSLSELETQIIISNELKYLNPDNSESLIDEINQIQKMISVFNKNNIKSSHL